MSRKTLALIATLLVLTIILLIVALMNQRPVQNVDDENTDTTTQENVTPTPDVAQTTLMLSPNPVYPSSIGTTSATRVNVEIDTGTNEVSAVQLEIQYDPAVLTNMRITPGDFFPTPNVLPVGGVNAQEGTISFAVAPASIRESKNGTGTVAVLEFTPRATAGITETEITLLETSLVTQFGQTESVLRERKNTRVILPLSNQRQTSPQNTGTPSAQQ